MKWGTVRQLALGIICGAMLVCSPPALADPEPGEAAVFGGTPVNGATIAEQWSFIANVRITDEANPALQSRCGGALVAPRWVLTAAHCVVKGGVTSTPGNLLIRMGRNDLSNTSIGHAYAVDQVIRRSDFQPAPSTDYDVALLRLAVNSSYTPISIVGAGDGGEWNDGAGGVNVMLAGWGLTDPESSVLPNVLHAVTTPLRSHAECTAPGQWPISYRSERMVCYGVLHPDLASGVLGEGTCPGDSGGPVVLPRTPEVGPLLLGTVSFGSSPCGVGYAVASRLDAHQSWIAEQITANGGPSAPVADGNGGDDGDGGGGGDDDTVPTTELGELQDLRIAARSATSLTLAWNAPTSGPAPEAYRVTRIDSFTESRTATRKVTFTKLAPNRSYTFHVESLLGADESATVELTARTLRDTARPSRPGQLVVVGKPTRSSVVLRWTAAKDNHRVSRYEVLRRIRGANGRLVWRAVAKSAGARTSISLRRLKAGTPHAFVVRAIDASGNVGATSAVRNVRTPR